MQLFIIIQIAFDILAVSGAVAAVLYAHSKKKELDKVYEALTKVVDRVGTSSVEFDKRLHDLEGGLVPDYEEAVKATNEVNGLMEAVNNLLSYDESAYIKARRSNPTEDNT